MGPKDNNGAAPDGQEVTSKPKARILVVDDDKDITHYLAAILTLDSHDTVEAYRAEEAIEFLKEQDFDLVLTDLMMPGMGGLGLLTYLKQSKHLPFIPVIMITALHDTIDKAAALEAGADDFLNKPVNRAELQARVRSLLRLKRANDALNRRLEENDAILQGVGERYLQIKQERDRLVQVNMIQMQRDVAARVAAAIWKELEEPIINAINLTQTALREGQMQVESLEVLSEELKKALRVTSKLEQLTTEANKKNLKRGLNSTGPLTYNKANQ